jgi:DNA-binding GntR family transcriptional regulator
MLVSGGILSGMSDSISMAPASSPSTRELDRPNLKAAVASSIRELILGGSYRQGDKINQDQLAADFRISRLPIREALIVLEAEGLVENIARRGAFVAPVSRSDVLDHYAIFGAVAGIAAARAATELTDDQLAHLQAIIDQMRNTTDLSTVNALCFSFHREVNQAGAARRLRSELRRLSEGIPSKLFTFAPEWRAQADADHVLIHIALSRRDPELADKSTRDHLHRSGQFAVERLERAGFWSGSVLSHPAGAEGDAPHPDEATESLP